MSELAKRSGLCIAAGLVALLAGCETPDGATVRYTPGRPNVTWNLKAFHEPDIVSRTYTRGEETYRIIWGGGTLDDAVSIRAEFHRDGTATITKASVAHATQRLPPRLEDSRERPLTHEESAQLAAALASFNPWGRALDDDPRPLVSAGLRETCIDSGGATLEAVRFAEYRKIHRGNCFGEDPEFKALRELFFSLAQ